MSLEDVIVENTKALTNLAAIMSAKGGAPAGTVAPAGRGPGRPKKLTLDDVKAIAEKVKEEKGRPAAVSLIQKHGAESLAGLPEAKYAAFIAAAEVLLQETDPEPEAAGEADL